MLQELKTLSKSSIFLLLIYLQPFFAYTNLEENGPLSYRAKWSPALQYGGALSLVAHMSSPTGEYPVKCNIEKRRPS